MQKTGLSRGFFYKNPIVRGEIDAAMEQQAGMVDPRRNIISQAMEAEMNLLRQQLQKLKSENENLIKENQKLKKALSKKELNLICIFRKNCASVPEERSAIPLQTEQSSAG